MQIRLTGWVVAAVTVLSLAPAAVAGQTAGGQGIPRTSDGRPDLSGIWQVRNHAARNLQDQNAGPGPPGAYWLGIPASPGVVEGNEIPCQPWARARKPFPFQIVQTPATLAILDEYLHAMRHVLMDGSSHPAGAIEWWMGDSRGRREGDTLVVTVEHVHAETWFGRAGNCHSEDMHLAERYPFLDRDTITG